ncbi:hypothetical protein N9U66_03600, partial [Synechococcus sp. AH-736-M20]|nr:hypothetical protein [Synechococcus sp. AH-736-M20]
AVIIRIEEQRAAAGRSAELSNFDRQKAHRVAALVELVLLSGDKSVEYCNNIICGVTCVGLSGIRNVRDSAAGLKLVDVTVGGGKRITSYRLNDSITGANWELFIGKGEKRYLQECGDIQLRTKSNPKYEEGWTLDPKLVEYIAKYNAHPINVSAHTRDRSGDDLVRRHSQARCTELEQQVAALQTQIAVLEQRLAQGCEVRTPANEEQIQGCEVRTHRAAMSITTSNQISKKTSSKTSEKTSGVVGSQELDSDRESELATPIRPPGPHPARLRLTDQRASARTDGQTAATTAERTTPELTESMKTAEVLGNKSECVDQKPSGRPSTDADDEIRLIECCGPLQDVLEGSEELSDLCCEPLYPFGSNLYVKIVQNSAPTLARVCTAEELQQSGKSRPVDHLLIKTIVGVEKTIPAVSASSR